MFINKIFQSQKAKTYIFITSNENHFQKRLLMIWNYKVMKYNIIIHLTLIDQYRISYV